MGFYAHVSKVYLASLEEGVVELKARALKAEAENVEWLKVSGNVPLKLIDPEKYGHLVNENAALRERVKTFEKEEARRHERCADRVRDTMRKLHGQD